MRADVRGPDQNYVLSTQAQISEDQGITNAIFGVTDEMLTHDDLLAERITEYRSFSERFLKLYTIWHSDGFFPQQNHPGKVNRKLLSINQRDNGLQNTSVFTKNIAETS